MILASVWGRKKFLWSHLICRLIQVAQSISNLFLVPSVFILQIVSAYSIYRQSYYIKVYKHLEENADDLSQDLPFSKKHFLGITAYFCLVP